MFRRSWRRAAMLVAGVLVFSLTACDSGDPAEETNIDLSSNKVGAMENYGAGDQFKATEPLKFSMLYNNHPNYQLNPDWLFWKELSSRTNISIDPVAVQLSDYKQKRSVLISAGDAPFIIPKTYHPDENAYVSSGAIVPVSDYLDLMPNFKDKIEKWKLQPEIDTLRQSDGKFYLLPGLHEKPWQDYSIAIRTDILEQLNLKTPKTWDDFYQVLKAMKAAYPDITPFSDRWNKPTPGGALLQIVMASYGTWGGWGYQHATWDPAKKKYVYTGASEQYKQGLQYLNKLVSEGLIDQESFTQTDDEARKKLANGKSFAITANAQELVNSYRKDLAAVPNAKIAKIPLPLGPAGEVNPASRLENGIMISKQARESKNFVAMMQFIDWLWYSDDGQMFAKWGVEGTTYVKGSDGKPQLAPDVNIIGLNPKGTKNLQKDFGVYNGIFAYGGKPELVQAFFSEEEREIQKVMGARKPAPWVTPPPAPFTDEEREQATLWETTLKDYVEQQALKFAMGQRPFSEWDAYVTELKGKNMTQYLDTVNKAYERYQKEHG
jgi:putative aldouronate transport system substrate-binding protein